jgi:hypothetical protein
MIGALVAGITGSGGASLSSYESIATASGTGSSNTITFSAIPSTFKHLQIRFIGRTDNASTPRNAFVRLNSDTGANYAYHNLYGSAGTVGAQGAASQTEMYLFSSYPGTGTTAGIMGFGLIDLLDYGSTTKNKTMRAHHGYDDNTTGAYINISSGLWMSTSAVTSISIVMATGNWTTNSSFALYGIKEA